eukprot:scaffold1402_cov403-Prasinococcus_capsulatus_cf.AAC.11
MCSCAEEGPLRNPCVALELVIGGGQGFTTAGVLSQIPAMEYSPCRQRAGTLWRQLYERAKPDHLGTVFSLM